MASLVYSRRSLDDIEQAFAFLHKESPASAMKAYQAITSAIAGLQMHPMLGRRIDGNIRELIISYGHTGYMALYLFSLEKDEVRILAHRHQRQVGFRP